VTVRLMSDGELTRLEVLRDLDQQRLTTTAAAQLLGLACRTAWSRNCGSPGWRTLAEGNALLPAFIADYNTRFAKLPANAKDLHRPLRAGDDLDDAFAWKEERTLSQALTLQYDKVLFILEPSDQAKAAIGKRVR
jgi:hypothetical protein